MGLKLLTYDGETLTGLTYADLTRQLWVTARNREPNKLAYMAEVSRRVSVMYAKSVRTERCRIFLRDLERAGLITLLVN